MAKLVSVIMVTYNAEEWTKRSLAAISDAFAENPFEVVIVDNASTSLDKDALAEWAGDRSTVEFSTENLGFGRGCNRAVELAKGDVLLFLNPDAVMSTDCGDTLVDFLESDPSRGIVGGRIESPEGELDYGSCWGHQNLWSLACFATGISTAFPRSSLANPEGLGAWERDTPRDVGVVTGCLMMMRRDLFDRLGGFDPRFFMYGEDADLCWRAEQLGYRCSITPEARAVHAIGASSSRLVDKQVMLFRGKATLIRLRANVIGARLGMLLLMAGVLVRSIGETRGLSAETRAWTGLWRRRAEWMRGW